MGGTHSSYLFAMEKGGKGKRQIPMGHRRIDTSHETLGKEGEIYPSLARGRGREGTEL